MERSIEKFLNEIQAGIITKVDASEFIGVSRPTLDKRIMEGDWRKGEKLIIKNRY